MATAGHVLRLLLGQRRPRRDNGFLDLIASRRSCRRFLDTPVTADEMHAVLEAGHGSPSTVNQQTWAFFPFTAAAWRDCFGAPLPFGAPAAVIVCADLSRIREEGGLCSDYPLFMYTLGVMNASLAAMTMTMAIEALGMRSVMLSQTGRTGIVDVAYITDKLSLPAGVVPLMTIAFGHPRDAVAFSPPKLPLGVVVHEGRYHRDPDGVRDWDALMDAACRLADGQGMREKLATYERLLPEAEQGLEAARARLSE